MFLNFVYIFKIVKEDLVMKNNIIRIVALALLVAVMCCAFSAVASVNAMSFDDISPDATIREGASDDTGTAESAQRILQAVLTVAQVIGVGVAVIMLIVLAIKYISAAPSDKAEIKKHMVVYVVGAIVLFAASGILEMIKRFAGMVKPAA